MKKVAIGCGIAALVIIALLVGVTIFSVNWMKGQVAEAERYSRISKQMVAEYGEPLEFVPPADGNYDPDRIALFARMRVALEPAGEDLRREANDLVGGTDRSWMTELRSTMRLLNSGASYLATADSILLDAGMSHGEYAHLQVLWLQGREGLWPADFADGQPDSGADEDFLAAFDDMADEYGDAARELLQAHARNARDAAEELGAECADCPAWIAYLDEQLDIGRTRRAHVPLVDPLPASVAEHFDRNDIQLSMTRPSDYGSWLMAILMVMELEDDDGGVTFNFGD